MPLQLVLWGETPETALSSALHSVNCFLQHQQHQHNMAQAALTRKIERVHEQCKQKLQQVHNGYVAVSRAPLFSVFQAMWVSHTRSHHHVLCLQAKRKYHEVAEAKAVLEADNAELQQKYTLKAG